MTSHWKGCIGVACAYGNEPMVNSDLTIVDFIQYFYSKQKKETISGHVAVTILCIFDAFIELFDKKQIEKISIRDMTNLSGYSRTTFYKYFSSVYEVRDTLESMLFCHVEYFSPLYYAFFTSKDKKATEITMQQNVYYMKYLNVLLRYEQFLLKYKEAFRKTFIEGFPKKQEYQHSILYDYLIECIASANSNLMVYFIRNKDAMDISLITHLHYAQIINNNLTKLLFEIMESEIQSL